MGKNEIFEMVICEMMEAALAVRRETCAEGEQQLYKEIGELSVQVNQAVKKLPPEEGKVLDEYLIKTGIMADHECAFLYVQGAKDCAWLLKKLGVL